MESYRISPDQPQHRISAYEMEAAASPPFEPPPARPMPEGLVNERLPAVHLNRAVTEGHIANVGDFPPLSEK